MKNKQILTNWYYCVCVLCSKTKCRLLVTHDDYSMMSKLPNQRTSVVTILRNPVDRVFSTYEFSIEVAARFLLHPNLSSVIQMSARIRSETRGVSTLDIWPWKYLVPWMREDLFARASFFFFFLIHITFIFLIAPFLDVSLNLIFQWALAQTAPSTLVRARWRVRLWVQKLSVCLIKKSLFTLIILLLLYVLYFHLMILITS